MARSHSSDQQPQSPAMAAEAATAAATAAPEPHQKHVAVIGAGYAGLATARTLLAQGQGQVKVSLIEATAEVGGRAKRGQLASGFVELGATWFHGTVSNPVFDLAQRISGAQPGPQQDSSNKDRTANATGSDPRWELELVSPGEPTPLTAGGPRHQAVLSAFEEYSIAVEEIAEDAEAAAAAAVAVAGGGGPAGAGCSLGQILRARFEKLVSSAGTGAAAATQQQQQQQQQQQGQEEQPTRIDDVAAWLASDDSGVLRQSFAEGWGCRERLQRAYDGFHGADVAGLAHMTEYIDLEGPNIPVPGGYQAIAEALAAEAQGLGLQLHLNCPVDRVLWARPDGKVALRLLPSPAAAKALAGSTSSTSSTGGDDSGGSSSSAAVEVLFDACVFTGSLGVLKTRAEQLFEPSLPASKTAAISQLHVGQVEKLFVEWPAAAIDQAPPQEQQQQQQQQQGAVSGEPSAAAASPPLAAAGGDGGSSSAAADAAAAAAPKLPAKPVVGPRLKPKQLHDIAPPAADAAATSTAGAAAVGGNAQPPYTTYCLLWPTQQEAWGTQFDAGASKTQLPMDIPASDSVFVGAGSSKLPEWLQGLHSWRYGDGPEWIKPSAGSQQSGTNQQQQQQQTQPASRSVVIWVTGRAAQQMASLSDEQVLADLELLLDTYPAIPRPDSSSLQQCKLLRSTWTTSAFTRGSYSYPSAQADGSTADALAAPLLSEAGARAMPVVLFAGEATSRQHMGTVHGAFNSGVREATRLLSAWGLRASAGGEHADDDAEAAQAAEYHAAFWL